MTTALSRRRWTTPGSTADSEARQPPRQARGAAAVGRAEDETVAGKGAHPQSATLAPACRGHTTCSSGAPDRLGSGRGRRALGQSTTRRWTQGDCRRCCAAPFETDTSALDYSLSIASSPPPAARAERQEPDEMTPDEEVNLGHHREVPPVHLEGMEKSLETEAAYENITDGWWGKYKPRVL